MSKMKELAMWREQLDEMYVDGIDMGMASTNLEALDIIEKVLVELGFSPSKDAELAGNDVNLINRLLENEFQKVIDEARELVKAQLENFQR